MIFKSRRRHWRTVPGNTIFLENLRFVYHFVLLALAQCLLGAIYFYFASERIWLPASEHTQAMTVNGPRFSVPS